MKYAIAFIVMFSFFKLWAIPQTITTEEIIYFENNSTSLSYSSKQKIELLVNRIINENKSKFSINIIGYTDSIGSLHDNIQLSENRAKVVYNEFMNNSNSSQGIVQTIITPRFPSLCYYKKSDTADFIVNISYHGAGIFKNNKDIKKSTISNSNKKRKVIISITERMDDLDRGCLVYSGKFPNRDSTIYFGSGANLLLESGSIMVADLSKNELAYDAKKLKFQLSFNKTEVDDVFKNIIEYNNNLLIILGSAHVDSFRVLSYTAKCKAVTSLIKPVYIQVPLLNTSDTKLNLFSKKILRTTQVSDSSGFYLQSNISDNLVLEKRNLAYEFSNPIEKEVNTNYFDVTIDVNRDTIYLVKKIDKTDSRQITIIKRGSNTATSSLQYTYLSKPINVEFERIKNYLLVFKQYEATIQLYGTESDVRLVLTDVTRSKRPKKLRLKNYKATENNYVIKERKIFN